MNVPASRPGRWMSRSEVLLLASLLLFILSMVGPGWWAWKRRERLQMARVDLRVLVEAVERYHREYGGWPGVMQTQSADLRFGRDESNAHVLNVLRAQEGLGNPQHRANEQQLVFIEVDPAGPGMSGLDTRGAFLDPWGTEYQLVFDANYDNVCEVEKSMYGRLIGQGHAIWSCGPDRLSDTPDDLLTWARY